MKFDYTAKTMTGSKSSGELDASSLVEARGMLRQQGLFALGLKEQSRSASKSGSSAGFLKGKRVSKKDVMIFTSQLSIMTQSGLDFAEALFHISGQCKHPEFKKVLETVTQDITQGKSISEALAKQEHIFGPAYSASVAAGEASGNIPEVLSRLCEMLKNEMRLASTLKTVLSYPVVLVFITFLVVNALLFFVLPQFGKVFADMDVPVPVLTSVLLDISAFVRANVLVLLIALGTSLFAFRKAWKTQWAREAIDSRLVNTIIIRDAIKPLLTGRSFRLLGTMLQSGIPLLEGIRLCRSSISNSSFRKLFDDLESDVVNGRGIENAIMSSDLLPSGAAQMIATAEKSGKLGMIALSVGEFYEEEGQTKICEFAKYLEPMIIVFMGILVSGVVLSVMLPLLDFSTASSM